MARGIWSGTISFGLVTIPVRLVSALVPNRPELTMLHAEDAAPLERRMICEVCGEDVPPRERVRGFEIEEGRHVPITDRELEALDPEKSRSIDVESFVPLADIDPLLFGRSWHLKPESGGEKPYALLAEALTRTGRAGLARFVLKARERLVALWAMDGALVLSSVRFGDERLSEEGLPPEDAEPDPDAVDDLVDYVERATRPFEPEALVDENALALMRQVRRKLEEDGVENAPQAKGRRKPSEKEAKARIDARMKRLRGED